MEPAIVTLLAGLVLGYLAQRSRFCMIGGLRDFILVRDTELLKGAIAFFVTAWVAFSIAGFLGWVDLRPPRLASAPASGPVAVASQTSRVDVALPVSVPLGGMGLPLVLLTAGAGIALGLASTLANGCPTRQHVLAAQGIQDSVWYLVGFYGGVIVFYLVTKPLIALFM